MIDLPKKADNMVSVEIVKLCWPLSHFAHKGGRHAKNLAGRACNDRCPRPDAPEGEREVGHEFARKFQPENMLVALLAVSHIFESARQDESEIPGHLAFPEEILAAVEMNGRSLPEAQLSPEIYGGAIDI